MTIYYCYLIYAIQILSLIISPQDMDVKRMRQASRNLSSSFTFSPVKRTSTGGNEGTGTSKRGNNTFDPNVNILMPEDISKADLDNVADRSGGKIYNAHVGTTCHQCR